MRNVSSATVELKNLKIEYRPLDSLRVNPQNPRLHTSKQISQIARSIEEFGAIMPVVIDRNSQIIVGHGRVQAAQLIGIKEFPTISVEYLTEAQAKAFAIADNKLTALPHISPRMPCIRWYPPSQFSWTHTPDQRIVLPVHDVRER